MDYDKEEAPEINFGTAIDDLAEAGNGKGVVILIDEYDDPVATLLDQPDEAEKVRQLLASFYKQIKSRTGKIRFLMITGVSKFTKMSVFSALSNLKDLSMEDECATMLGYTEKELDEYFGGHLRAHAKKMELAYTDYRAELKRWFNGYRFGQTLAATVYNPVSIGVNLSERKPFFQPCWSQTGKASMLMNFLKRDDFLSVDMDSIQNVLEQDFDVTDIRALKSVPMLFQTGYLTIADYNRDTGMYTLRVPDEEVRRDLATLTTAIAALQDTYWVSQLAGKLLTGKWDEFFEGLKSLYASLPYRPKEKKSMNFPSNGIWSFFYGRRASAARRRTVSQTGRRTSSPSHRSASISSN